VGFLGGDFGFVWLRKGRRKGRRGGVGFVWRRGLTHGIVVSAGALEALELEHGSVELAVDQGFVADEPFEVFGAGEDVVGGIALEAGDALGELGGETLGAVAAVVANGDGFEAIGAAESPVGNGEALGEELLEGAFWLEVVL
jgi:hypothetical protein